MKIANEASLQDIYSLLNIAVVGHTNTGKTSLIRTMLRSTQFGKIEDGAGTTRHVERATIFAGNEAILNLHDTPGIEDSHALSRQLKSISSQHKSLSAAEILEKFISTTSIDDPLDAFAMVVVQMPEPVQRADPAGTRATFGEYRFENAKARLHQVRPLIPVHDGPLDATHVPDHVDSPVRLPIV